MSRRRYAAARQTPDSEASGAEAELCRELEAVADREGVELELRPPQPADGESVLHGPERRARDRG